MAPFVTPANTAARATLAALLLASAASCDKPQPTPAAPAKPVAQQTPTTQPPSPNTPAPKQPAAPTPAAAPLPIEEVTISGKTFKLELAAEDKSRIKGLSGRTEIAPDGGMLFAFSEPRRLNFVMRDCPIAIDIIFLDPTGRVVATHKMKAEEPKRTGESDEDYERRLRLYPSGYGAQFAIELKDGSLDQLKLKNGDQIKLDLPRLKQTAK